MQISEGKLELGGNPLQKGTGAKNEFESWELLGMHNGTHLNLTCFFFRLKSPPNSNVTLRVIAAAADLLLEKLWVQLQDVIAGVAAVATRVHHRFLVIKSRAITNSWTGYIWIFISKLTIHYILPVIEWLQMVQDLKEFKTTEIDFNFEDKIFWTDHG